MNVDDAAKSSFSAVAGHRIQDGDAGAVGLGYVKVGPAGGRRCQAARRSGVEARQGTGQRARRGRTHYYILDEPTTGCTSMDVRSCWKWPAPSVVDAAIPVVRDRGIISTSWKTADWVLALRPKAGDAAGKLVRSRHPVMTFAANTDSWDRQVPRPKTLRRTTSAARAQTTSASGRRRTPKLAQEGGKPKAQPAFAKEGQAQSKRAPPK